MEKSLPHSKWPAKLSEHCKFHRQLKPRAKRWQFACRETSKASSRTTYRLLLIEKFSIIRLTAFFPSNAFMGSLHTFNRSKKMNCKLSCKAVYTSIASKALVMDQYTIQWAVPSKTNQKPKSYHQADGKAQMRCLPITDQDTSKSHISDIDARQQQNLVTTANNQPLAAWQCRGHV